MSFGFAVGDFIAVGDLAHRLWRDVYSVARAAPQDLKELSSELSVLSQSISILVEDLNNPNSTLIMAGDSRVKLVTEMMAGAKETLTKLQDFAKKHGVIRTDDRPKVKKGFDRLRYAKDASALNSLRSKLVYHNGVLNLLLTSVGNSSLERLQSDNQIMSENISQIKTLMIASTSSPELNRSIPNVPLITIGPDQDFQIKVSQLFMSKAEVARPWISYGIDVWMQAGRWWLLKACSTLRTEINLEKIGAQAYTDLLKASWILVDVVAEHPQRTFLHASTQQLELRSFANTIRQEYEKISQSGLIVPCLSEIEACEINVWPSAPTGHVNSGAEAIFPSLHHHVALSESSDSSLLYQG